jgi:nitrile hydratase
MRAPNDLGGTPGFGRIEIEADEPTFHHDWEGRTFAMEMAARFLRAWNIDQARARREWMSRDEYLATSYYGIWLYSLERMLEERGVLTAAEVAARRADPGSAVAAADGARVLRARDVEPMMSDPRASRLDAPVPARFAVGDAVLTRTATGDGHTRLPVYARARHGVVTADHGVWIFADAAGRDLGFVPGHVYTVRFAATELWGERANRRDTVYLDLWDDHLEAA